MEFGIWFEPEMISEDSDLAREHPEWIMQTGGRLPVRARNQQVLNLTIPEAYDHVHGQLTSILSEYDLAYVKWDHNRDLIDAGTYPTVVAAAQDQTPPASPPTGEVPPRFPR